MKIVDGDKIPDGGFLVCANHSDWKDPLFVGQAVGFEPRLSVMAKKELFRWKPMAGFISSLGAFPVSRGQTDVGAVRKALSVLKAGERLLVFPEGTRHNPGQAKDGVGMFALRTGCRVLPVYISPQKRLFRRTWVVVGDPYVPEKPSEKPKHEDYTSCADEILRRVYALAPKACKTK